MREEQMPVKRLSMRHIREILRLKWACGLSDRRMAQRIRISRPTVAQYLQRAKVAGLSWPLPEDVGDDALERQLFAASSQTQN
jgi:DNA-binding transcriptional regulator LsrR (DeoR family)